MCGAVKCTKSLVICFVLCLLRQLLSALILSHWGKRRTFIIHFYYKRNLIFPKAHKLYASQEFHFGMKINTTSISINILLVSVWSAGHAHMLLLWLFCLLCKTRNLKGKMSEIQLGTQSFSMFHTPQPQHKVPWGMLCFQKATILHHNLPSSIAPSWHNVFGASRFKFVGTIPLNPGYRFLWQATPWAHKFPH